MAKTVFITGASGCVGHYVVQRLLEETDLYLYLLLRDAAKLRLALPPHRGELLLGGLDSLENYSALLGQVHYGIHLAACWGGTDAEVYRVNVERLMTLVDLLSPQCDRLLYFSTASLLDQHNQLIPEAATLGTDYIRTKYAALTQLRQHPIYHKTTVAFPTLVFGGSPTQPYSHLSAGLRGVMAYAPLLRFVKAEGSLHFIHGYDIAQMVVPLLLSPPSQELVLGMPRQTVNQLVAEFCQFCRVSLGWQLDLSPWMIDTLIRLFRIQMAPWDYFCLQQRHFTYRAIAPEDLGLSARYPTLSHLLADVV
jgi:nucleoside-diphosphate-sugar epimerase